MFLAELYRLKYILLIELFLLTIFAVFDLVPFLFFIALIFLGVILYLSFNTPVIAVHIFMFAILLDSFGLTKTNTAGPSVLIIELCFVMLLALFSLKFLSNLDKKFEVPSIIIFWIPFLIWGIVIGLLVGVDKIRVVSYWKNYFAGFIAFSLASYSIKNKLQLKSVLLGIIIWALLLSIIELKVVNDLGGFSTGLVGLYLKKNLLTLGWGRSNYLAAFFVIIIPVTIGYLFYTESKKMKSFLTLSLLLMSFALILTLSRGGILALLIALIILFSKLLKARTFLPIVSIVLVVTIVVLLNPLTYVLVDRMSSFESSGSVFSRINYYQDVWHAFLNNPITGVGFGNLSYYATFILAPDASPAAHNIILGALGEVGVIGTFFYFLIIGLLLKNVFHIYRIEEDERLKSLKWCLLSSILGGLIHTLVEPTLDGLQFSIMFWTLAGVYIKLDMLKISDS